MEHVRAGFVEQRAATVEQTRCAGVQGTLP